VTAGAHSTILIVEDEKESRDTLREILELEGYDVETAENGREALAHLDAGGDRICVVLLDLYMPVMDGWQLIERLRADGRLARTPILVVTSAADQAPADLPVLQKPIDIDKVMREIERLC
jgi:CheY-like chemotaxis protein